MEAIVSLACVVPFGLVLPPVPEKRHMYIYFLKGNGRAFCSGADVVALYHLSNEGERSFDVLKFEWNFAN